MKHRFWVVFTVVFCFSPLAAAAAGDLCAVIDIDRVGHERLENLKSADGARWWVELGDELLLCGEEQLPFKAGHSGFAVRSVHHRVDRDHTYLVRSDADIGLAPIIEHILVQRRRLAVVTVWASEAPWNSPDMVTLPERAVVIRQLDNDPPRRTAGFDASIQTVVDEIDEDRWFADIESLAAINRHSLYPGIFDAEDWIAGVFGAMPGLTVTRPGFFMGGREVHNVVAELPGSERPDDWIIVGGHYDSTSEAPETSAPGAEDNASGCAGVIELARAMVAHPPEATVFFICYVGEEQNLLGSKDHVADLVAAGDADKVEAMLNMDMIGYTADADLDCLLESEAIGQFLIDGFADAAQQYTTLRIETYLYALGSDHVPYLDEGIPALLTIENDWNQYPYYHTTSDLPANISLAMGREVLKMNVATVAQLAGSGLSHIFSDGFESGDTSTWSIVQAK